MPGPAPDLERRRAGVCLHLTALPGGAGIGELGRPAYAFLDWMHAAGLGVWQFLPAGPTGFGNSPYQPLSVFAGNPLLVSLDGLVDLGLLDRAEIRIVATGADDRCDYARAAAIKLPLLARAARRFDAIADTALMAEFEAFAAANAAWLDDYAAFVLLKAGNGELAWPEWRHSDRRHDSTTAMRVAAADPAGWRRVRLIQYFFARQWDELRHEAGRRGIALFGDVPIYMALDCAESWAHPELLLLGDDFAPLELAGVPPDYFSADGQLWGNPVYRWDVHAADGFRWWIARLAHALEAADFVRLDHFRGFEAFWSVPAGATTAHEGSWRPGPGHALFDALASALGSVPFVAEDLGVITEAVTALRKAYALPGMQVLQFLVDRADFSVERIGEDCVCYTGTHDNDTTPGWYAGSDGRLAGEALRQFQDTVRRNIESSGESIYKDMIRFCFSTRARTAIAPMQDFLGLGSRARFNTPGAASGNWLWRLGERGLGQAEPAWIQAAASGSGRT